MLLRLIRRPFADIRRIGPPAARSCAAIHAQAFPFPWSVAEFEALLAGRDIFAEAATVRTGWRCAPKLGGFILSRLVLDEAEVLTVAVAPRFRRRGMGGALLAAHVALLAARGAKTVFLEVEAANVAALALYGRYGFRQIGARKAYYRKPGGAAAEALVLRLDLA